MTGEGLNDKLVDDQLAALVNNFGMEAVLDATARWLDNDLQGFLADPHGLRGENEESRKMHKMVAGLIQSARDHVRDASMDWYVSTK